MALLRVAAAVALLALGAASGAVTAAGLGYWQCVDGRWTGVGAPAHPPPDRLCDAPRRTADSADACVREGGRWGAVGIFPVPVCSLPARDAGRVCADSGECEGLCAAEVSPGERDALVRGRGTVIERAGRCAPRLPVVGCHAKVERGVVRRVVCLD